MRIRESIERVATFEMRKTWRPSTWYHLRTFGSLSYDLELFSVLDLTIQDISMISSSFGLLFLSVNTIVWLNLMCVVDPSFVYFLDYTWRWVAQEQMKIESWKNFICMKKLFNRPKIKSQWVILMRNKSWCSRNLISDRLKISFQSNVMTMRWPWEANWNQLRIGLRWDLQRAEMWFAGESARDFLSRKFAYDAIQHAH